VGSGFSTLFPVEARHAAMVDDDVRGWETQLRVAERDAERATA
jgi:hypothetical protein